MGWRKKSRRKKKKGLGDGRSHPGVVCRKDWGSERKHLNFALVSWRGTKKKFNGGFTLKKTGSQIGNKVKVRSNSLLGKERFFPHETGASPDKEGDAKLLKTT